MSMKSRTLGKLLVYGVRIGASACFGVCACSGSDHDVASSASDQHTASASTGAGESGNAASTTSGGAGGGAPATAGSQSSAGGAPATTDGSATGTDGGATTGPDYPDIEFVYDPEKDMDPVVCAEETLSAEPLPLDMYIILDRTGSMIEEMPAGEDCQLGAENRLDAISYKFYGTPALWWVLARVNDIADPLVGVEPNAMIRVPTKARLASEGVLNV